MEPSSDDELSTPTPVATTLEPSDANSIHVNNHASLMMTVPAEVSKKPKPTPKPITATKLPPMLKNADIKDVVVLHAKSSTMGLIFY